MNVMGKLSVVNGKVYKGQVILARPFGFATIYPTWLGGTRRVDFNSMDEAIAYVDAALACRCFEYASDNQFCPVHGAVGSRS